MYKDGVWIAAEFELDPAPQIIDQVAGSLLRLRNKVVKARTAELATLMVVTSTGAAYRRPDGVEVAPITALGQ